MFHDLGPHAFGVRALRGLWFMTLVWVEDFVIPGAGPFLHRMDYRKAESRQSLLKSCSCRPNAHKFARLPWQSYQRPLYFGLRAAALPRRNAAGYTPNAHPKGRYSESGGFAEQDTSMKCLALNHYPAMLNPKLLAMILGDKARKKTKKQTPLSHTHTRANIVMCVYISINVLIYL